MIPLFPKFKKLDLKDKQEFVKHLSLHGSNSDWNFIGLWGYNTKNDILTSRHKGNIAIRSRDYLTNDFFYSFIGTDKTLQTSQELINLALKMKINPTLKLVPETVIKANPEISDKFIVKEDRDNFDYILSVDELCELNGKKYRKHRRAAYKFKELYPHYEARALNISTPSQQKQILKLFNLWKKQKNENYSEHEYIALKRTMKDSKAFLTLNLGLFDKEKLVAFVIADLENKDYAETHFVKCDYSYEGAYQILRQELAKKLKALYFKYINIEQDMGIDGLRFAKEQWNPVAFLKKYTISPKDR